MCYLKRKNSSLYEIVTNVIFWLLTVYQTTWSILIQETKAAN